MSFGQGAGVLKGQTSVSAGPINRRCAR